MLSIVTCWYYIFEGIMTFPALSEINNLTNEGEMYALYENIRFRALWIII